jgi:L-asparaginase/Glu-tRNA(Gln) amidotransferase subunit D
MRRKDPPDAAFYRKTVIITGAQIPLSELFNDSIENLLGALIIAGSSHVPYPSTPN